MTVMVERKLQAFRLDPELCEELDKTAKAFGCSKSELARLALEAGLAVLMKAQRDGKSPLACMAELEAIKDQHADD